MFSFRKHLNPIIAAVLLTLTLSACGGEAEPEQFDGPGSEFVQAVEVDTYVNHYTGLRCIEGYQTFDIDDMYKDEYKFLDMSIRIGSDGEFYDDDPDTDLYEGFYAQDWASIKLKLRDDVELPVIVIHTQDSGNDERDDQLAVPRVGAGGQVSMRFATDNYLGGYAGEINGLTLCLKVAG